MAVPQGNRGTLRSPTFKSSVLWLQPWPLAGGIPQARFKRAPAGPSSCLALLHKLLLNRCSLVFLAILICITVKAMAGLNGLTLGKCRVAVRICRQGDVWKNQMWHFPCWRNRILCGSQYNAWQFWSAALVNNTGKVSWWLSIVFKSVPLGPRRNWFFFFAIVTK